MAKSFPVTIFNYESEIFSGEVEAISSINAVGPFDVLGDHSDFISLIRERVVLHSTGKEQEFAVESGVLRCRDTAVHIYIVPPGKSVAPAREQ